VKVTRHSNYLSQLRKEINIATKEAGISEEDGLDLIDEYFVRFRELLQDARMPTVAVPELGVFRSTFYNLSKTLKRQIKFFKKGTFPRYRLVYDIKRWWKLYKKAVQAKYGKDDNLACRWNEVDPQELEDSWIEGIKTDLPDNYFKLEEDEWLKWLFSEPRFESSIAEKLWVSIVYNSTISRRRSLYNTWFGEERFNIKKGKSGPTPERDREALRIGRELVDYGNSFVDRVGYNTKNKSAEELRSRGKNKK